MAQLGIDIGGTGIKGAPVNLKTGELTADRFRIPTPHPAVPDAVAEVVGQVAEHFKHKGPVGVTFPGICRRGVLYSAANVDDSWIGLNAAELFTKRIGQPCYLVNDADAAGVAEMQYGAGKGKDGVVILLTLGTGIGSAVFNDGVLVPNTEFGHLTIRGKDAEKRASEKVREDKDLSWHDWSKRIIEFLEEMVKLFSPDLFIIGGGVSKKADKFIPHLKEKIDVPIVPALLQNNAGISGAAYLAAQQAAKK